MIDRYQPRRTIGLIAAVMMLILASAFNIGQSRPAAIETPFPTAAIDTFVMNRLAAGSVPGLALAITQKDKVLLSKGYGFSRPGVPITPHTRFFIASLSKSFTALAVMQLVDAEKLELDAPVQRYLPTFRLADAVAASQITVRHLLNQTSGLADSGFPEGRLPQPATIQERVETLQDARPVAVSGAAFHYFNPNYAVLARLVEKVSAMTFGEYLRMHIFEPLDMADTFAVVSSAQAFNRATDMAQGHLMAFGFPIPCAEMRGYLGGSGGVVSTAQDMARYLIFQNGDGTFGQARLVSENAMQLMHSPPEAVPSRYAMGWFLTEQEGQPILEHNGILSAYYADAALMPKAQIGITLLYNIDSIPGSLLVFPHIQSGIISILNHRPPPGPIITVRTWGRLMGAMTLLTVGLGIGSLVRCRRWIELRKTRPQWHLVTQLETPVP